MSCIIMTIVLECYFRLLLPWMSLSHRILTTASLVQLRSKFVEHPQNICYLSVGTRLISMIFNNKVITDQTGSNITLVVCILRCQIGISPGTSAILA
jgi:hypothetical protein